ncbi:MAPEG family protein [Aureimonas sp. AU4]|uniref:MAPEG family protein n=1 Tax=Aureimonas sp. AU4 TaxID=1638163 RepID=UPI0009E77062|nr:MAPEG family protein [Aureimonas sp. AU4]
MASLPHELVVLVLALVLFFVQLGLQGMLATRELGSAWNAGPRDGDRKPAGVHAGRAQRALDNFKETFPVFLALALALVTTDRDGGLGSVGAWIWLLARIAYVPLYLAGIPYIRSLVWLGSIVGLGLMGLRLLLLV